MCNFIADIPFFLQTAGVCIFMVFEIRTLDIIALDELTTVDFPFWANSRTNSGI